MNIIIFTSLLTAIVLCNGGNTISLEFKIKDCEYDCAGSISNPHGKMRISGIDRAFYRESEIIEESFIATELPFTLDITIPDDPASLINFGTSLEENSIFFVELIWDSDANLYYHKQADESIYRCYGDIIVDGDINFYPEEDPYYKLGRMIHPINVTKKTQTVYVQQTENDGSCHGRLNYKLECSPNYRCNGLRGEMQKMILYGIDSRLTTSDVTPTKIYDHVMLVFSLPSISTIAFPENPSRLIEPPVENPDDAKFYFTLTGWNGTDCIGDLVVDNEYHEGPAYVTLEEGDEAGETSEAQIIYVHKRTDGEKCGAAECNTMVVKLLLCLYFVFYIFI